jgi:hypothetical protein
MRSFNIPKIFRLLAVRRYRISTYVTHKYIYVMKLGG